MPHSYNVDASNNVKPPTIRVKKGSIGSSNEHSLKFKLVFDRKIMLLDRLESFKLMRRQGNVQHSLIQCTKLAVTGTLNRIFLWISRIHPIDLRCTVAAVHRTFARIWCWIRLDARGGWFGFAKRPAAWCKNSKFLRSLCRRSSQTSYNRLTRELVRKKPVTMWTPVWSIGV